MRIKSVIGLGVIGLEDKDQLIINEFADLIRSICDQGEEDCSKCYFKPLCPNCVDVVDSFCELWNESETIEVEIEE